MRELAVVIERLLAEGNDVERARRHAQRRRDARVERRLAKRAARVAVPQTGAKVEVGRRGRAWRVEAVGRD